MNKTHNREIKGGECMTQPSEALCQFWYEFMLEYGAIEQVLRDEGLI